MPRTKRATRIAAVAVGLAVALVATGCTGNSEPEIPVPAQAEGALDASVVDPMREAVNEAMTLSGSNAALVGVWAPWAGTWVEGFGENVGGADVASIQFKTTSITRAMTCDVLYGMESEGIVGLGDSVTDWVNGVPELAEITLGQLCDSTGGLEPFSGLVMDRWVDVPTRVWEPRELIAYGMSRGLVSQPGSRFRDADTSYMLLGQALQNASGKSAGELYTQYVFEPLGLEDTSLPATMPTSNVLPGFRSGNIDGEIDCDAPIEVTTLSPSAGGTASGVVSDLDDVARYVRALAQGMRPYDTDERYAEPFSISERDPSWFTARGGAYQAGSLLGQFGSMPGYLTSAFSDRETGLTVVVVLNNSRGSGSQARSLSWELAALASKAPAAAGEVVPETGYPWTPEDQAETLADSAICS